MNVINAQLDTGGMYCDSCEHSLSEIPDPVITAEMRLAFSVVAEDKATIAIHFGHLRFANIWLSQAIANAESFSAYAYPRGPYPMIYAMRSTAQALAARQRDELVLLNRRIAKVSPHAMDVEHTERRAVAASPSKALGSATCAVQNKEAAVKGSAADAEYPDSAKDIGAVGSTQVKVTLDASGQTEGVSVYASSGNKDLDASALQAARATAYEAEIVNCLPRAGSFLFKVDFTGK